MKDFYNENFIRKFSSVVKDKICIKLIGLSEQDIRLHDASVVYEISNLTEHLFRVGDHLNIASETFEKFNLAIALKYFISPYLTLRLTGLNDIKNYIFRVTSANYHQVPGSVSSIDLNLWMTSSYVF